MWLSILILFMIGVVCAFRMPALPFALIVVLILVVYAISSYVAGTPVLSVIASGVLFAVAVEGGYALSLFGLYVRATKKCSRSKDKSRCKIIGFFIRDQ
jgi:uncharacterized protein YqgC (DUF456 family)